MSAGFASVLAAGVGIMGLSLVVKTVKNRPAMQETQVRSLGQEDPLEEGMATHSSIPAWRIPMDRGTWWATVPGLAKGQTQLKRLNHNPHLRYHRRK